MTEGPDTLEDVASGSGRHALFRLARAARAGALSAPDVADRIERILANDMRRIERRMDQVRFAGNAAAHSAPRENEDGEAGK